MSNTKSTKRALLSSVMAMLICVAMLIGTTFAWFTDSASTAVNKIQAGTLDIGLEMKQGDGWVNAEGQTLAWQKAAGAESETVLWEPGCTYKLPTLKITNKGNLALQFKILVNNISGDLELLDALEFTCKYSVFEEYPTIDNPRPVTVYTGTFEGTSLNNLPYEIPYDASAFDFDNQCNLKGYPLSAGEIGDNFFNVGYYTIEAHMKESAGNEYQGLALENLSIIVVATQVAGIEMDSFDDLYDKDAEYPVVVSSQAAFAEAVAASENSNIVLSAGTYTLPAAANKTVAISGTKDTVIDMKDVATGQNTSNAKLAFEGVTVEFANSNYKGIQHAEKVVYKDCTITGKQFMYANNVEFINCKFVNLTDYCVWTYGAKNITFTDCEFTTGGKAILVYNEQTTSSFVANVTLNNCTFNSDGTLASDKAAVETGSNGGNTETSNKYNITFNGCTINGFAANNSTSAAWGNKNSMDQAHLNVVIDGVDVY